MFSISRHKQSYTKINKYSGKIFREILKNYLKVMYANHVRF